MHANYRHITLIFGLQRFEHITDALVSLHWLRVPHRIAFKLAVLTYRAANDFAPRYLSSQIRRTSDAPERRNLRSVSSNRLTGPRFRLHTAAGRAFSVTGAISWNELPTDITSSASLGVFWSDSILACPTPTLYFDIVWFLQTQCSSQ